MDCAARRGKSSLTVIDLIGQQHREFRFEDRLKAILDARRGKILDQVEDEFPFLPAGCTVDLDRQSQEIILENLKSAVRRSRWATLVDGPASGAATGSGSPSSSRGTTIASRTSTRATARGRISSATPVTRRPQRRKSSSSVRRCGR